MVEVADHQIAAYENHIAQLAREFVGWNNAELDDLIQEGRLAVWSSLQDGQPPSTEYVRYAMRLWVTTLGRQIGK